MKRLRESQRERFRGCRPELSSPYVAGLGLSPVMVSLGFEDNPRGREREQLVQRPKRISRENGKFQGQNGYKM